MTTEQTPSTGMQLNRLEKDRKWTSSWVEKNFTSMNHQSVNTAFTCSTFASDFHPLATSANTQSPRWRLTHSVHCYSLWSLERSVCSHGTLTVGEDNQCAWVCILLYGIRVCHPASDFLLFPAVPDWNGRGSGSLSKQMLGTEGKKLKKWQKEKCPEKEAREWQQWAGKDAAIVVNSSSASCRLAESVSELRKELKKWLWEKKQTTLRRPKSQTEKGKEKRKRRRLTGGRDRWETRAAATMIETRCRPLQVHQGLGKRREGEREREMELKGARLRWRLIEDDMIRRKKWERCRQGRREQKKRMRQTDKGKGGWRGRKDETPETDFRS